jgi:2-dehydropantoate 2-reductase
MKSIGYKTRICVAGAGAIGITLAARLIIGGHNVGLIAKQESVDFIRENGLRLDDTEGRHELEVDIGVAADFHRTDLLFLCAKSHDLPALAQSIAHLIGPDTTVVPVINGIPWWYFDGIDGAREGKTIFSVDPQNVLKKIIPSHQVIGTTTVMTAQRIDRGSAVTFNPLQMTIGELNNRRSWRLEAIAEILRQSGITTNIAPRIRDSVWTKVTRNLISNPLTAITGATLRENFGDPYLSDISRKMLYEVLPVVSAYEAKLEVEPEAILEMGKSMGDVKTSMLQDYERGQRLELSSICDAVLELAALERISMPVVQTISNVARFRNVQNGRVTAAQPVAALDGGSGQLELSHNP